MRRICPSDFVVVDSPFALAHEFGDLRGHSTVTSECVSLSNLDLNEAAMDMTTVQNDELISAAESRTGILESRSLEAIPLPIGSLDGSLELNKAYTFLECYYTNANSLNNKMVSLNALAASSRPDVIAISETWFDDDSCTHLYGYSMYNSDRDGHGGVALYVNDRLDSFEVHNTVLEDKIIEQIWCVLKINDERLLLGCMYRPPPNIDIDEQLRAKKEIAIGKSLTEAARLVASGKYDGLCVSGDFNYNRTTWDQDGVAFISGGTRTPDHAFVQTLLDSHLHQHIWFPTFVKANGKPTNTLDLLLTDNANRISEVECGPPLSDACNQFHVSITWRLELKTKQNISQFRRSSFCYGKGNYVSMCCEVFNADWAGLLEGLTVNEAYEKFVNIYNNLCEKWIPKVRHKKDGRNPPWLNSELRSMISRKKRLWKKIQMSGSNSGTLLMEYKCVRNEVKKATRTSILNYEKSLFREKNNRKRFYAYIKTKQSLIRSITALKNERGEVTSVKSEMCNILNKYFKSVFVNEDVSELNTVTFSRVCDKNIENINISYEDLSHRLSKLNQSKSPGPDGIHPLVLKKCHSAMAVPLGIILRKSLESGEVPVLWKLANVTPIHKKASRLEPQNYRPVSLTSVPCKLMERILRDEIMKHLVGNSSLAKEQHGFVPYKSCTSNLLETFDVITGYLSDKNPVDVVFLDFAKAFDKVPHERLLLKLKSYGIEGKLHAWIRSFLTDRKQRVVMGNVTSMWEDVTSGVPQGSVLGPLLFLVYINDMPSVLQNKCKLYADDSKIISRASCEQDRRGLQSDLDNIIKWTDTWLMRLNFDKCKIMHFGKNNPKYKYSLFDSETSKRYELVETESERDLGIIVSNDAKWHKQVNAVCAKANSMYGWMKRAFKSRDPALWNQLYKTYIRPQLEFAVQVWNPYSVGDVNKIERVQRRVTKTTYALRGYGYEERLKRLGLETHKARRERGDLIQKFKIDKGIDQVKWFREPLRVESMYGKRVRLRRELVKSCEPRHHFFNNRIVNRWNELPNEVKESESVNEFKNKYDNYSVK